MWGPGKVCGHAGSWGPVAACLLVLRATLIYELAAGGVFQLLRGQVRHKRLRLVVPGFTQLWGCGGARTSDPCQRLRR